MGHLRLGSRSRYEVRLRSVVILGSSPADDCGGLASSEGRRASSRRRMCGPASTSTVERVGAQALVAARRVWWPSSDWVLPVVLAVIAQADVWVPASYSLGHLVGPAPVVSVLYVVTALALGWRKRSPVAVLAFIVSIDAVEYL